MDICCDSCDYYYASCSVGISFASRSRSTTHAASWRNCANAMFIIKVVVVFCKFVNKYAAKWMEAMMWIKYSVAYAMIRSSMPWLVLWYSVGGWAIIMTMDRLKQQMLLYASARRSQGDAFFVFCFIYKSQPFLGKAIEKT